jgi:large subunit ribosomal protein L10
MSVVGGIMNSLLIDATAVKSLARLPSKQELLGQVVGTIAAPVSGFVRVLAGNLRGFVQVLSAMSKKS